MKYVLNHSYMFTSVQRAWVVGFLQTFAVLGVEFCNIEIILSSDNPLDIVYNFVVLDIIAQFDDFVYSALRGESMKQLVEDAVLEKLLVI